MPIRTRQMPGILLACAILTCLILEAGVPKETRHRFEERYKESSTSFGGNLKDLDGTVLVVAKQPIPANYAVMRYVRVDIRDGVMSADREHEQSFRVGEPIWIRGIEFKDDRIEMLVRSIERDDPKREQHRSAVLRFYFEPSLLDSGELDTVYETIDQWVHTYSSYDEARAALNVSGTGSPDLFIGDFHVPRESKEAVEEAFRRRYRLTVVPGLLEQGALVGLSAVEAVANSGSGRPATGREGNRTYGELARSIKESGDVFRVQQPGIYGTIDDLGLVRRTPITVTFRGSLRESSGRKDAFFEVGDPLYLINLEVLDHQIYTTWLSQKSYPVFDERRGAEWRQRVLAAVVFEVDPKLIADEDIEELARVIEAWLRPVNKSAEDTKAVSAIAEVQFENEDVVKLLNQGFTADLIIAAIQAARQTAFQLDADALIALKTAGASDEIIKAMLEKHSSQ